MFTTLRIFMSKSSISNAIGYQVCKRSIHRQIAFQFLVEIPELNILAAYNKYYLTNIKKTISTIKNHIALDQSSYSVYKKGLIV